MSLGSLWILDVDDDILVLVHLPHRASSQGIRHVDHARCEEEINEPANAEEPSGQEPDEPRQPLVAVEPMQTGPAKEEPQRYELFVLQTLY